ncbi:hypothetical protein [Aliigemmobacter aestuarii]|uniref:hypothetical protein n=1 Tax=Aliigemmobacter aestuarii TaxID=1445661 RepID=UPI001454C48D|nr:hypothetical protein [Gemmobacter aestuarii]
MSHIFIQGGGLTAEQVGQVPLSGGGPGHRLRRFAQRLAERLFRRGVPDPVGR